MASPPPKKVVLKPMFFKRKVIPSKPKVTPSPSPSIIDPTSPERPRTSASLQSLESPTRTELPTGLQGTFKKPEKERSDLDFWGRSKDVHAGMLKLEEEKLRQKESEHRRKDTNDGKENLSRKSGRSKKRKSGDNAIVLSDCDDDERDGDYRPRKHSRTASSEEPEEPFMDANQVTEALAAYRQKQASAILTTMANSQNPPAQTQTTRHLSTDPADAYRDVIVNILIVSNIPNTTPKVFNRRFGQSLGIVRQTWTKVNNFSTEDAEKIVLVWQNRMRIFDAALPKSLGIRFNREGKMYMDDKNRRRSTARKDREEMEAAERGINPEECKIFFQAMWESDWEELSRKLEREKELDNISDEEEEEVSGIELDTMPMFITLKGKNFKELKLRVKPSMAVAEVVKAIREERNLDADTDVVLRFDGDELEEDTTLEEAEIEHEFQIDVVLK